jgi:hypothetical protein
MEQNSHIRELSVLLPIISETNIDILGLSDTLNMILWCVDPLLGGDREVVVW